MSPQRYEAVSVASPRPDDESVTDRLIQVNSHDDDGHNESPVESRDPHRIPNSPPPSFRSRASSPSSRRLLSHDPLGNGASQDMDDAFDDGSDSDADNDGDDRQRLMRANSQQFGSASVQQPAPSANSHSSADIAPPQIERRVTEFPSFRPSFVPSTRPTNAPTNDGVFANLSAKPERGEQLEEKPPTYEQAAADATPPYWETTVLAPGMSTDEVYVDGLPVGSLFSFIWNGMISTAFQFPGFVLTYLLHTTHAAKNGSRAGLGLTLILLGLTTRGAKGGSSDDGGNPGKFAGTPTDPNSHDFDPSKVGFTDGGSGDAHKGWFDSDWMFYVLMILGWFILIRAVVDFLRVKRHERMVLESPNRGLPIPIIAEGESPEHSA